MAAGESIHGANGKRGSERADPDHIRQTVHDLRQSISAIAALTSAAMLEPHATHAQHRRLATVLGETERLSVLARRLVECDDNSGVVRLDAVARNIVVRSESTFRGRITTMLEPVSIVGDPLGWWRAIGNMVDNACRAAGDDGKVHVTVDAIDGDAVIEVADSGSGFGAAAASGVAGLGLPIVMKVVDAHDGKVEIARGRLGGAVVRVVLTGAAIPRATDTAIVDLRSTPLPLPNEQG